MSSGGPDLLGQLKRLLAATPAGTYAAPTITRRTLEEIINEIATLRVALEMSERRSGVTHDKTEI